MIATTVTGTERRSPIQTSELQTPTKASSSQSMTSPIDKFPSFSDESHDTIAEPEGPHSSSTVRYTPHDLWEPRKAGAFSREHGNGSTRASKHRPRKSISEAISTIRTRNASVSANAQELAQALRAPVSYQLIVRYANSPWSRKSGSLVRHLVALSYLVHDLSRHEHFIKIYFKCFTKAHYPHRRAVCFCVDMVFGVGISFHCDALAQEEYTGPQKWHPLSVP